MKYLITLLAGFLFMSMAYAEIDTIVIKDGDISKNEISIPANTSIEFKIMNLDENFDEFSSQALNLKIEAMPVNSELTVKLPPLTSGIYPFKVEFEGRLHHSKDKNVYGTINIKQ
ncbi:hypothetical protein NOVO_00005 [Rickettsiales bacterium Ac37b]|nr:hypothetical protein NOVO_00005 [Rickettsiales bacterium Ac37b]